jgi:hypothetical protein
MAYPKNKQMVGENVLIWKTLHFDAEKTEIYNEECKELQA